MWTRGARAQRRTSRRDRGVEAGAGPLPRIELLRLELPTPARGRGLSCLELPLIYRVRPGPPPLSRPSPRPLGLPREVTPGSGPTRHPPRSLRQLPRSVLHIWSYPHPALQIWSYRPLQVALTPDLLRSPMVTPDLLRSEGRPVPVTPDLPRSAVDNSRFAALGSWRHRVRCARRAGRRRQLRICRARQSRRCRQLHICCAREGGSVPATPRVLHSAAGKQQPPGNALVAAGYL